MNAHESLQDRIARLEALEDEMMHDPNVSSEQLDALRGRLSDLYDLEDQEAE